MNKQKLFLATTALEEFWDKNSKILFLGEWCKLYNRKDVWSKLDYIDMPFIWKNDEDVLSAYDYCQNVLEKVLDKIAEELNSRHNLDKSKKYYKIILGTWLQEFIHQAYDKYCTLKYAQRHYNFLKTYIIEERYYQRPVSYNNFIINMIDDVYSIQIYSQIIKELGIEYEYLCCDVSKYLNNSNIQTKTTKRNLKSYLAKRFTSYNYLLNRIFGKRMILITSPYFSDKLMFNSLKLVVKSKFNIVFNRLDYNINKLVNFNNVDRCVERVKINLEGSEFEKILSVLINKNIPLCYSGLLGKFREKVLSLPIKKPDIFFTANALSGNEIFKFLVAEYHAKSKLLDMQHGGGYGFWKRNTGEDFESDVSDIFYTWGWGDNKHLKYLPPKLKRRVKNKNNYKKFIEKKVLFTSNTASRYVRAFQVPVLMGVNFQRFWLSHSIEFLKRISNKTNLTIRLYPSNHYKLFVKERMEDVGIRFRFDDFTKQFQAQLEECYIFVADHTMTTFLQALSMDKPTIIFMDNKFLTFRDSAQWFFEELKTAKILHSSGVSAAKHLNAVYEDVDTWWQSTEVQNARKSFVEKYARSSPNWTDEWVKEFNRVLAKC